MAFRLEVDPSPAPPDIEKAPDAFPQTQRIKGLCDDGEGAVVYQTAAFVKLNACREEDHGLSRQSGDALSPGHQLHATHLRQVCIEQKDVRVEVPAEMQGIIRTITLKDLEAASYIKTNRNCPA